MFICMYDTLYVVSPTPPQSPTEPVDSIDAFPRFV